jgi:Ala-tRNA(Pro) deacylase
MKNGNTKSRVPISHDGAIFLSVPKLFHVLICSEETAMPVKKLKEFLDNHDIKYISISHSPAYDAQRIAASAHISGKELAKTVIVRIDDKIAMVVLPASCRVHLGHLKTEVSASHVELATETEVETLFPDCEMGAMPPFGNLYDIDVYVAEQLAEDKEIAFSAGLHTELVRMSYEDFDRLVSPTITALT